MSKLLIGEYPLQVLPKLAAAIGLNEAIALQQLHYWLNKSSNVVDGKRWVYNTYEDWQRDNFPFWSVTLVGRIFRSLEDSGLVISKKHENGMGIHRKWYRIDYENFDAILTDSYKMTQSDDDNLAQSTTDKSNNLLNTETTPETTSAHAEKMQVPGIGWSIAANRKTTQEDIDASKQDTAQDRLSGWRDVAGITNEHIMVADTFWQLSKIRPPKAPRGKSKAGESAHFYAWKAGIEKLLPLGKVSDVLQAMKSAWAEYSDGFTPKSPDGMMKAVYEKLNTADETARYVLGNRIGV